MKVIILSAAMALASASAFAHEHASQNPDAQAIDQACTADAATAGCGKEQVGTGLLKCLWAYKGKPEHKDFKFSDGCKAAMHKMHQDRKEAKEGK